MNEWQNFIIIGGGGHSKCVIDTLNKRNIKIHSIFDDNHERIGPLAGCEVTVQNIPDAQWWKDCRDKTIIAIGSNSARKQIANRLGNISWGNAIHPTAVVCDEAIIGQGVYIGANVIIQPGAVIGDHCIINTGSIIEHDVIIDSYCHIAPGSVITGGGILGQGVLIGAGSVVIPEKNIGEWSVIGAGSVVVSNVGAFKKAYGNPCRVISTV